MSNSNDFTGYNKALSARARELRRNATWEENTLWYQYLLHYPIKFHRQRIIENYIVDFYSPKAKLVIELDGSQHFTEEGMRYDAIRTEVLQKYGLQVLRFTNTDIQKNLHGVCELIDLTVHSRCP